MKEDAKRGTMRVLGGANLPSYWERFDRLQCTANQLGALAGHPRGVFRFESFEALEAWKAKHRNPAPPSKLTASPAAAD